MIHPDTDRLLEEVLEVLRNSRGVDLGDYRHATLRRRFDAHFARTGVEPTAYLKRLRADSREGDCLIDALTVNVSSFFRDPVVFEILSRSVLPEIIDRKIRGGNREIRVWSAGCATGEEAYSVAILTDLALRDERARWTPLIFATDISEESLAVAKLGVYDRPQLLNTKLGVVDKYFVRHADRYRVHPKIRELVKFSRDDLTQTDRVAPAESVFGAFDLVLCRNVLIYFGRELQSLVLAKLHRSLDDGGYLALGAAGFVPSHLEGGFTPIDRPNRIYQKS